MGKRFIEALKPGVPKRYLLLIAALVWTYAGVMLLIKGSVYFTFYCREYLLLKVTLSVIGGIVFFILVFHRLSGKHVKRIFRLNSNRPCVFYFFSLRTYIIMAVMIASSLSLRKFNLMPPQHLPIMYVTMGIPLFFSSFKFYYYWYYYRFCENDFTG